MNPIDHEQADDAWDHAVAGRLAQLRAMPVDASGLERAIRMRVAPPRRGRWTLSLRPLRALAASAVVASAIAATVLLSTSGGPALAEVSQMVQFHQDIVSGRVAATQVDSIAAANRMLDAQSPGAPTLPQVPAAHVMACCMKSVHRKRMACVLLKDGKTLVTLSVASAADMRLAPVPVVNRGGASYRVQQVGDLSMVMTERDGKWLCLIGQAPAERLMDLAAQLRF